MEERRQVAGWGERARGLHKRMTSLNWDHFFQILCHNKSVAKLGF